MMKSKIALSALMMAFAFAPAHAETTKKKTSTKSQKQKSGKAGASKKAAPAAAPAERRQDRAMDALSGQFLNALWRFDPEGAIYAGKYDTAALLTIPDAAHRSAQMAFITDWQTRFGAIDASQLSPKQRTDLGVLVNKLNKDKWSLTTFRDFAWDPSQYNIAGPIDLILTTNYAAEPQRLRTLLKRIANVPAYYEAARANILNPTREHTQLAIEQGAGVQSVLSELDKAAQASQLTAAEKQLYTSRIAAARTAVDAYVIWLGELDKTLAVDGARSFRIGKDLYEQKFAFEIQSASTGEQTYQKALAMREQTLTRMDSLSDELWSKTMGDTPKPADRVTKIGMVIDKLSANHVTAAEFLPEIRRLLPTLQTWVTSHDLLTLDPKKPLVVRETPAYMGGVSGASLDAPGPYRPQDRSYFNVSPLLDKSPEQQESTLREYNHWIMQILSIHEAIPGHYAQLIYANKSPSLVKSLFGNGAMVEGWANYGERMMLDSGYGDNAPEMWLMYSKWNLRGITNTILDYSVHVLNMPREQAIDMLTKQAFQTPREAEGKWKRVQLSSVQLTSYFSGFSEITELRDERKAALGSRFSVKGFNEQFLSYGNAPVRVIKELMTGGDK